MLLLQPILPEHLEQLRRWRNQPELRQYFREYRDITPAMQHSWYDSLQNDNTQRNFAIYNEDLLIGHCSLNHIHWVYRTAEFSIYIGSPQQRGKGYGVIALTKLLDYGFYSLNLNRIWGEVYSHNPAFDLYLKMGFKKEGVLHQTVFKNGEYYDSYIIAILKGDYI